MTFAERLHSLRLGRKESLQDLASAVGISKAHAWELEKGRSSNPSYELVRKLAAHYGVAPEALTGEAELPPPENQAIGRIHRNLEGLSDRDLRIIESMIDSMRSRPADGASS